MSPQILQVATKDITINIHQAIKIVVLNRIKYHIEKILDIYFKNFDIKYFYIRITNQNYLLYNNLHLNRFYIILEDDERIKENMEIKQLIKRL